MVRESPHDDSDPRVVFAMTLGVLVQLAYLTKNGWVDNGDPVELLHPEQYPVRMRARKKFGRSTELDADLRPTGRVWVSDDVPSDPSVLVGPFDGSRAPHLPDPSKTCLICGDEHHPPYDGSCLL